MPGDTGIGSGARCQRGRVRVMARKPVRGHRQAAKLRLMNDLRAADTDLGDAAVIADFAYLLYVAFQNQKQ
jgi:hypothetical protein